MADTIAWTVERITNLYAHDFERKYAAFSGMHANGIAGGGIVGGVLEHGVDVRGEVDRGDEEDDERRGEIIVRGDELEVAIRGGKSRESHSAEEEGGGDWPVRWDTDDDDHHHGGSYPSPDPALEHVRIDTRTPSSGVAGAASEETPWEDSNGNNDDDRVEVALRRRCPLCAMDLADHPSCETECPFCPVSRLEHDVAAPLTSTLGHESAFAIERRNDKGGGPGRRAEGQIQGPPQRTRPVGRCQSGGRREGLEGRRAGNMHLKSIRSFWYLYSLLSSCILSHILIVQTRKSASRQRNPVFQTKVRVGVQRGYSGGTVLNLNR